jgi:hypothetical protein
MRTTKASISPAMEVAPARDVQFRRTSGRSVSGARPARSPCDNAGDLGQNLPLECFGSNGQSATLVVIEAYSPAAELLSKNAVLLAKVINDLQLPLAHPAGDGDQPEMEWVKDSLGLQSPLSPAPGNSREQSRIQADPLFGPYGMWLGRFCSSTRLSG